LALQTAGLANDYEAFAAEYYDVERHPTCANFREGSRAILGGWLETSKTMLIYCDVGAGMSLPAEILAPRLTRLDRMFLLDDSPAMLTHSSQWAQLGAHLMLADVSRRIPLETESVDVLVASLGDPYNIGTFWAEVHRVIRPGGRIFYTTPSYEWAVAYRTPERGGSDAAEFELADGRSVCVPSHVYPCHDQVEFVTRYGLVVDEIANVPAAALSETSLSPKLLVLANRDAAVVTGYALTRLK
jgi:SAM-dependent methyltransferase